MHIFNDNLLENKSGSLQRNIYETARNNSNNKRFSLADTLPQGNNTN